MHIILTAEDDLAVIVNTDNVIAWTQKKDGAVVISSVNPQIKPFQPKETYKEVVETLSKLGTNTQGLTPCTTHDDIEPLSDEAITEIAKRNTP